MKKQVFGKYIVADPRVCHGQLTFKGTRILVEDVLDMVADGFSWDYILNQWNNAISKMAISEAVLLSKSSLISSVRHELAS